MVGGFGIMARDGSGLIQRSATPALTTNLNIYVAYGQSNSAGASATFYVSTSDYTRGACRFYGRDGSMKRDGTGGWTNAAYPVALRDFSLDASTEGDEPHRALTRENFFHRVMEIVNKKQIDTNGQRHRSQVVSLGHTLHAYTQLDKGENAYANLVSAVTKMCSNAVAASLTPVIKGVLWVQGEQEFATTGSGYAANMLTLFNDLNTDLKPISGQAADIPLFITQQSNFSCNASSAGGILYPVLDQLQAHIDNPNKVILCGPMYAGETTGGTDLHYRGPQTVRWANAIGNAVAKVAVEGGTWEPVRPKTVTRSSNVVEIQFHVPNGALVLDTSYVNNTADGFYGFDFRQTGGTTTLTSVALKAGTTDTLQFTLSNAPDGTSPKIRAGRNSAAGAAVSGPRTGARTCLRDSASSIAPECNWCVHFDVAVP